jgi:hypothetical protein
MGTNTVQATTSAVESALNAVAGRWVDEDPPVLAFPGDGMPVVANVRGHLRCLSYRVVDPYPVTRATVERLARRRGGPHVILLSEHPACYEKRLFRRGP